jgi:membrane protein DedA with SNARE-associated domain
MPWPRFFVANAAAAILWATVFGLGAYMLGEGVEHLTRPAALALGIAGLGLMIAWVLFLRAHEEDLQAEAERVFPGPLITRTIEPARR